MSRSIHTTKREIDNARRFDYSDPERRAEFVSELEEEAKKKRRIKGRLARQRAAGDEPIPPTDIELIPIRVTDAGTHAHFPASPDDIRAVMRALPKGALDGLAGINLCLGANHQEVDRLFGDADPDPHTGRAGIETLPGVYCGQCLGFYTTGESLIHVFAHVYEPGIPDREMWECYLRLCMLSTFVHEAAHHYDFTMRVARGRWRMDDKGKAEIYAESVQHDWVRDYVTPHLQQCYPNEVKALGDWIEYHGGVVIPLPMLAGDPRTTMKNGVINVIEVMFGISTALGELAQDAAKGRTLEQTRLGFAYSLHCGEHYEMALRIIEGVLSVRPENLEAITLKADIYEHQERYAEAREMAESVVHAEESSKDAWFILSLVYEEIEEWQGLLDATTCLLDHKDLPPGTKTGQLLSRARAKVGLGDFPGANADLDVAEAIEWPNGRQTPPWVRRRIAVARGSCRPQTSPVTPTS